MFIRSRISPVNADVRLSTKFLFWWRSALQLAMSQTMRVVLSAAASLAHPTGALYKSALAQMLSLLLHLC